jgi:hypothetical protein
VNGVFSVFSRFGSNADQSTTAVVEQNFVAGDQFSFRFGENINVVRANISLWYLGP